MLCDTITDGSVAKLFVQLPQQSASSFEVCASVASATPSAIADSWRGTNFSVLKRDPAPCRGNARKELDAPKSTCLTVRTSVYLVSKVR